jgi:spermidine synthase
LEPWLGDAEINRDRNLRLQYLAGMELNSYQSETIFEAIVACRAYPDDLFLFSGEPDDELLDFLIRHLQEGGEDRVGDWL